MPSSNVCWGIEVGAGAIKAVKLETGADGVNVLEFVVVPHKKVLSTPELDQADALRVALGEFVSQYDLTGASVAMSVPGHSAFARFAKLPPVEPKKVPDIVKFEAVQQIPFPIDDVEWDYQTFVSTDTPEIEVGIFAITRERIMERLAMYEDVGIVPDYVTLSPVAVYNALAYDLAFGDQTPGTILLDIGTTSTDLIVCEPGRVWIRTFPIGGHHFTEALVNKFQLSYPKAEKLKKEAESTQHARHVFQAMRPVFGDLAQDVQRSIGYYQSLHKDAKLSRLIGLGSTFRLPGLRKFLKQQLQIDVYRLEQFKRLTLEGARAGELQAASLNLGTAYGLALQGLGESTLDVNLMPVRVIREAMWARKVPWFGVAAGVAVAASGAMFTRWFIDRTQIAENPRPQVVGEVIGRIRQAKTDAGDTLANTPNLQAADILSLQDQRAYFAYLLSDVSGILRAGEERAKNWPEARPGSKAASEPKAPGPAFIVAELIPTFRPASAGGETPSGEVVGPQPAAIEVRLVLTTNQPDETRFVLLTVDKWLKDNASRPGLPYRIVPGKKPVIDTLRIEPEKPGEGPAGERPDPGARLSTRGRQPTGEEGLVGDVPQRGGGGDGGGPAQTPEERLGSEKRAAAVRELEEMAPVPSKPGPDRPVTLSTVKATWEMVLEPPAPKEGGGS